MKFLKALIAVSWMCCLCVVIRADDPDPQAELNDARTLAREGKYEEALQRHIWFHENALKHQPSMAGVRLSFALSDWVKLGEKYPKARETLVAIRDKDTKEIVEGRGTFEIFHDVSAINRSLQEEPKTVALFKLVHEKYPDLAKRCYHAAERYLTANREYKLCSTYIPDALTKFDRIREMRELNLKFAANGQPRLKQYAERTFIEETCRLIEILVSAERNDEAAKVREQALAVQDDPAIRAAGKKTG